MNTLKDVQIDEISLVDEPANPGAAILLFKRDSGSAVDRAKAALEGVRKALGATKLESKGETMPATVADCDKAFKALVARFNGDPIKAADSREGKQLLRHRYEISHRLDRVEKQAEPEWKDDVAALDSVAGCDRYLAALVARTDKPRSAVYDAILRQPLGIALYERRSQLARAA